MSESTSHVLNSSSFTPLAPISSGQTLRIATRQSPLAMWQAEYVAELLQRAGFVTSLVPLVSSGDTDMRPIDSKVQVGVFTKRIEQALLDNQADVAVHSLKDLPTQSDPRLQVVAVPVREIVNDCLVSTRRWTLQTLPEKAIVGTGSRRRAAQLMHHRPDLRVEPIRGNVQTRLSQLDEHYDAIMLAAAGLRRLQMDSVPRVELCLAEMLPAPGQGALAIQMQVDAPYLAHVQKHLDHLPTRAAVTAERTLLANLNGGCLAPIAAHSHLEHDHLHLASVVLSIDGTIRLEDCRSLPFEPSNWQSVAAELAEQATQTLASQGARELIGAERSWRQP